MLHGLSYEVPLILAACGTVLACAFRCVTLLIGLRMALKQAPNEHHLPIYREFAHSVARGSAIPWHTSRGIRKIPEEGAEGEGSGT